MRAEFTLTRLGPQRFYLVSAGALETHDFDALEKLLPGDGSVRLDKVTTQRGVLVLAGPRSRDVLAKVADIDVSDKAFPWLTARHCSVRAAGLLAMRVNFVGELGYELHHPIETQNYVFDALMEAGARVRHSGPSAFARWIRSRLEKSYKLVGRELSIEYAALESGLERFVDFHKGPFLGRERARHMVRQGFREQSRHARGPRRDRRRPARLGAGDEGRRDGRPHDVGRFWLAHRQVAGAGDGEAGVRRAGNRGRASACLARPSARSVIADSPYDPENAALRA